MHQIKKVDKINPLENITKIQEQKGNIFFIAYLTQQKIHESIFTQSTQRRHHMEAKLHINILEGTLIAEGKQEFVETIYQDFKSELSNRIEKPLNNSPVEHHPTHSNDSMPQPKARPLKRKKLKKPSSEQGGQKNPAYTPQLQKNLDLSGIQDFYKQYEPKNNAEKILIFAQFLKEKGFDICTADQIYTCYSVIKERIPKVFLQAIRDTHGRSYGYIDHQGPEEIRLTTVGENHFNHDLKKKEAA